MSDTPEYGSVCQACGHINGAHLKDCRIAELERENADFLEALERAAHYMQNCGANMERDYPEIPAAIAKAKGQS